MKKTFTLNGKRMILAIVTLLAFAVNANAGSTLFAFYTKVSSYPTGKGQIYVTDEYEIDTDTVKFADAVENKMVAGYAFLNVYAKPADGYIFAGISQATPIYDEETWEIKGYELSDSIIAAENPAAIYPTSEITDNVTGDYDYESDSLTVASMMPLEPNNFYYALFTKVTVEVAENQSTIGSVKISKVCNDKGDEITLSAIPGEGSTFVGWTLNGDTVSTAAEYKITVGDETAQYVANFDNPNLITLHFDEWGSYIPWYDTENDLMLGDGVCSYWFESDSTVIAGEKGNKSYSEPVYSEYMVSALSPRILFGFGDCKVLKQVSDYPYANDADINRWSGDNGVSTDTLMNTYAYYTVDMDNCQLNLATAIPAQQVYVAMPDSVYKNAGLTAAPEIIYTSQWYVPEDPEGVSTVTLNLPGMGKVYAIDGKAVANIKKSGLYIKNGKKVYVK